MKFLQHKNIKIFVNYFLGPLLFVWLSWSIYRQVKNQPDLKESWLQIKDSFQSPLIWNLVMVMGLMVVNWAIEAFKWKLTIEKIQRVNFFTAFKAVLSGLSFSVTTPNRIGEYLGRILYMEEGKRINAVSLTIVGSISQLIITLLMGLIGLFIIMPELTGGHVISELWMKVILYGVIAALLLLGLFYFRLPWLVRWIDKFPAAQKWVHWIRALEDCRASLLLKLLALSGLRFIVFTVQYLLLFRLFGVHTSIWDGFWAVNVSFLVLAIIPTFAIAEVAQRGYIAKTVVGLYSANFTGIIFTAASIWFINLVIPAIVGSILILGIRKIIKEKKTENEV